MLRPFTRRERTVVALLQEGLDEDEIAERLNVHVETVRLTMYEALRAIKGVRAD